MKGSEYLREVGVDELSPLGTRVADFLGDWYGGFHNIVKRIAVEKVDWGCNTAVVVPVDVSLATYDFALLTKLVVMSFDRMLRVEIRPRHYRWLELMFHARSRRHDASMSYRLPSLEEYLAELECHGGRDPLQAWDNGEEIVAARSVYEASALLRDYYEGWGDVDQVDDNGWQGMHPEETVTLVRIINDGKPAAGKDFPASARLEKTMDDEGWIIEDTAQNWVSFYGKPCVLATSQW